MQNTGNRQYRYANFQINLDKVGRVQNCVNLSTIHHSTHSCKIQNFAEMVIYKEIFLEQGKVCLFRYSSHTFFGGYTL